MTVFLTTRNSYYLQFQEFGEKLAGYTVSLEFHERSILFGITWDPLLPSAVYHTESDRKVGSNNVIVFSEG